MTLPGQHEGPAPTLRAIRKVHDAALEKITGHEMPSERPNNKEPLTYRAENALAAESWSIVSAVNGPANELYGESAIYGRVPAYSVLTSIFSQRQGDQYTPNVWAGGQKELVVMPFSDMEVTAERGFKEIAYTDQVVLLAMDTQYGASNAAVTRARERVTWARVPDL
jgi:hypothetical protein